MPAIAGIQTSMGKALMFKAMKSFFE